MAVHQAKVRILASALTHPKTYSTKVRQNLPSRPPVENPLPIEPSDRLISHDSWLALRVTSDPAGRDARSTGSPRAPSASRTQSSQSTAWGRP